MKRHLFLIGFMGSGKTYWGERLADALALPFIDLDHLIEAGEGESIARLFTRAGEAAFRVVEQRYLHSLAESPSSIVATGGGTPCFFDNLAWMRAHGVTLWIDVPFEVLWQRLQGVERRERPLLAGATPETVRQLWQKRRACYQQADAAVMLSAEEEEGAFWVKLYTAAQAAMKGVLPEDR
ncbi:MAG: shikimate kinase [Saprospiraceae bacterium]|nr:shikimate kinase [Saprospiraceae bacterium]MDW8229664.1 shikimate kinase [Saprospiraceae bacterium]